MTGTLSNLIMNKSYGFIEAENGQRYFFHREDFHGNWDRLCSDWSDPGAEKIELSFEPKSTPKGPRASNVALPRD